MANYGFLVAILNFPDETGGRFFKLIHFTYHYYQTWKFAVWISKISQLVLESLAKKWFSAAILHFPHETGSRFIKPIFFTNHYHQTWKCAVMNLKISQLVLKLLAKNRFSAAILNFYDQTGIRIFEPIFSINLHYRSWKFAIKVLKISQLVLKLSAKNRFSAAILNLYDHTGRRICEPIFFTDH